MTTDDKRGPFEAGASGPNADDAAADAPPAPRPGDDAATRADQLLDEAEEESFPASDPASPAGGKAA